ncbi:MAG: hypothetical protein OXL96_28560 [Candidatus Poribacteria bacterium]|nr:hypothetical protein [Candidatus Poribacteria bacterium]
MCRNRYTDVQFLVEDGGTSSGDIGYSVIVASTSTPYCHHWRVYHEKHPDVFAPDSPDGFCVGCVGIGQSGPSRSA